MEMPVTTSSDLHPSFLPNLLDRYVTGDLPEPSWHQLTDALDTKDATAQERMAMAAFFGDAAREAGPEALDLPEPEEVQDILEAMRQA